MMKRLLYGLFTLLGMVRVMAQTVAPTAAPPFMGPAQCVLTLPPFPLTATGLATPFQLQGLTAAQPCTMANTMTTTFVEAVIFDPATNRIAVYHPIVVDVGTQPLLPPVVPIIPPTAIVALFFGTNGISLNLQPLTVLQQAQCVNGISQTDIFGQFAHCNGGALYDAVNKALAAGQELIPPMPPLGKGIDGMECPTTRSFFIVDQDPSDNLVTTYLLDPVTKKVIYDIPATRAQYPAAVILKNGSDNRLLTVLNAALGCISYTIPVLNDPAGQYKVATLATDELHAARFQQGPTAFIPKGDPMTRVLANGVPIPSLVKVNAYRKGVNQPQITTLDQAPTNWFCVHMLEQLPRLQNNKALFTTQLSPDPAAASTLFTFLANRFSQSYMNLKCDVILDVINPVTLTMVNNVVTDATFTIVPKMTLDDPDPYMTTPVPNTPVPNTPTPTTPVPITPTPTDNTTTPAPTAQPTTPVPTAINNVPASPNTPLIYALVGSSVAILIIGACIYQYCYHKEQQQRLMDKTPILTSVVYDESTTNSSYHAPISLPRLKEIVSPRTAGQPRVTPRPSFAYK